MCCNTKPGPRLALDIFREKTGLHVTQEDWHSIRNLAEESLGRRLSTSVADSKEAATTAAEYALSMDMENSEALEFIRNFTRTRNTEGTVDTVKYLAENGLPEEIAEKRIRKAAKKGVSDEQVAMLMSQYGDIVEEIAGGVGTPEAFATQVKNSMDNGAIKRRRGGLSSAMKDKDFKAAMDSILDEAGYERVRTEAHPAPAGFEERNLAVRGHSFYPKKDSIPGLYETDGTSTKEKEIHAHYVAGTSEWYVAEYDSETGEAFGYVALGGGSKGEWTYFSMTDIEEFSRGGLIVERDIWWSPTAFSDIEF